MGNDREQIRLGNQVRCLDGRFRDERTNPFRIADLNLPIEGELYEVRAIITTPHGTGIRLAEIQNTGYFFQDIGQFQEPIFGDYRFEVFH